MVRRRAHSRELAGGRASALESNVVPGFCGSPSICLWTDRQGGRVLGSDDWGLPVSPPRSQDTWVRQGLPLLHHYQKRLLAEVTGPVHPVVYWEILAELSHPLLPLQLLSCFIFVASPMVQWVKNLLAIQETQETWF